MPLVRLRRIGADVASLIYAKVESLNPGGSGGLLVSGDYWRWIIGVSSFFGEKRTDTNNPSIFPGKNDELTPDFMAASQGEISIPEGKHGRELLSSY